MELNSECLGIAVDTNINSNDIRALIQLLSVFKDYVENLFMDSPIIDLLVSQVIFSLVVVFF